MSTDRQTTRRFPMDDPFRTWRLLNGAIFGAGVAVLLVTAWVLYRDAGRAGPNTQASEEHRFTATALLVKAAPIGIDYQLELGVLNAADAQDARRSSAFTRRRRTLGTS